MKIDFENQMIHKINTGQELNKYELEKLVECYAEKEQVLGMDNYLVVSINTIVKLQNRYFSILWNKEIEFTNYYYNRCEMNGLEETCYFKNQPVEVHKAIRIVECWVTSIGDVVFLNKVFSIFNQLKTIVSKVLK